MIIGAYNFRNIKQGNYDSKKISSLFTSFSAYIYVHTCTIE